MHDRRHLEPGPDHPITVQAHPGRVTVRVGGTTIAGRQPSTHSPDTAGPIDASTSDLRIESPVSAAIALALLSNAVTLAFAQNQNPQRQSKTASAAPNVARGKYLVEGVAMCGQCHTPRDSHGNLDRTRWLQGAPVPWLPAKP